MIENGWNENPETRMSFHEIFDVMKSRGFQMFDDVDQGYVETWIEREIT